MRGRQRNTSTHVRTRKPVLSYFEPQTLQLIIRKIFALFQPYSVTIVPSCPTLERTEDLIPVNFLIQNIWLLLATCILGQELTRIDVNDIKSYEVAKSAAKSIDLIPLVEIDCVFQNLTIY